MKGFLKSVLLTSLTFVFGVAANAQIGAQYRAEIPFDFQINGVFYKAGKYLVGPMRQSSSAGPVTILDLKTGRSKIIANSTTGGDSQKNTGKMISVRKSGTFTLEQILTPTFELRLRPKSVSRLAGVVHNRDDLVVINLTN